MLHFPSKRHCSEPSLPSNHYCPHHLPSISTSNIIRPINHCHQSLFTFKEYCHSFFLLSIQKVVQVWGHTHHIWQLHRPTIASKVAVLIMSLLRWKPAYQNYSSSFLLCQQWLSMHGKGGFLECLCAVCIMTKAGLWYSLRHRVASSGAFISY